MGSSGLESRCCCVEGLAAKQWGTVTRVKGVVRAFKKESTAGTTRVEAEPTWSPVQVAAVPILSLGCGSAAASRELLPVLPWHGP